MAVMNPHLAARPNRRRRVRHKILTPAYASFTTESKSAILDLYEIVDISEDGVAIHCNAPLETSRKVDLCLDLAESSEHIHTSAQVIWTSDSGRSGLRFSNLPPASLKRLREWLFLNAMAGAANAQAEAAALNNPAAEVPLRPNFTDMLAALTAVQREVESLGSDVMVALQLVAARTQNLVRASGAAIALAAEDPAFMICRASSGPDAPPIGARLQVGSGFSGECVRTGKLLRCDDSESDLRVDRESCRALGLRSLLAAPVRHGAKVIGILEVFSQHAHSFTESDSKVLQRMAEIILAALNRTARQEDSPPPAPEPTPMPPSPGSVLFASEVGSEAGSESGSKASSKKETDSRDRENHGGVRLPRSLLIVLICAAATIAMAMGFVLAPWLQARLHDHGRVQMQTVLASSRPPTASGLPSPSTVDAASLDQLLRLAGNGDAIAQNALGRRYAQGDGVKLDEREAVRWFVKAAEQGHVAAQLKLGSIYWSGRGVPKDLNRAYFWTVLARAGGDEGGKILAPFIAGNLTRAQAAAIEQQAEQWLQQRQVATAKPAAGH
jgi:hypothetical protein